MGVRTRPGIKHDHRHNQQREALAEQHRNGIGPRSPPAAGWYPGLCRWHRLLPRDGGGRTVLPLSLDGCWASAALGAAPSSRVWGSAGPLWLTQPRCPGTGQRVPLVLWLCWVVVLSTVGAPANYGFFFIFLGFFLLFWQQTYHSRCPGESKTVHRGLPLCQPLRTGVRAELLLQGRDHGQEPDLCPPCPTKSPHWSRQFGVPDPTLPPRASHGALVWGPSRSGRERAQLNAFVNA